MRAGILGPTDPAVLRAMRITDAHDRILARTRREGRKVKGVRCLVWLGSRSTEGYGNIRVGQQVIGVHRVVFEHRHGPMPEGAYVCHHCDNPPCVEDRHHFLGSPQDNADDMVSKGRSPKVAVRGEEHYAARLTEDDVRAIRARRQEGETLDALAVAFGVTKAMVWQIVVRRKWSHVS